MLPALVVLTLIFGLLFLTRVAGAWRAALAPRWPAIVLAGLAAFLGLRGAIRTAVVLAALAVVAWYLAPKLLTRRAPVAASDPRDIEARQILGVGANAGEAEIRQAYRDKMTHAHPDRGGSHERAARLTAARDRLLRKRR
ncbi:MAG: DnaJ domain-containing protein [Terricaulis sp.]